MTMNFRDVPVTPVMRHFICDKEGCGGEMKNRGEALMSYPPQYRHYCEKCGHINNARQRYPTVVHI